MRIDKKVLKNSVRLMAYYFIAILIARLVIDLSANTPESFSFIKIRPSQIFILLFLGGMNYLREIRRTRQ